MKKAHLNQAHSWSISKSNLLKTLQFQPNMCGRSMISELLTTRPITLRTRPLNSFLLLQIHRSLQILGMFVLSKITVLMTPTPALYYFVPC